MSELVEKLKIFSDMRIMGEPCAFGEDASLFQQAAERIETLEEEVETWQKETDELSQILNHTLIKLKHSQNEYEACRESMRDRDRLYKVFRAVDKYLSIPSGHPDRLDFYEDVWRAVDEAVSGDVGLDRTVPYEEQATCERCGKQGALDYMGDSLCDGCA